MVENSWFSKNGHPDLKYGELYQLYISRCFTDHGGIKDPEFLLFPDITQDSIVISKETAEKEVFVVLEKIKLTLPDHDFINDLDGYKMFAYGHNSFLYVISCHVFSKVEHINQLFKKI